MPSEAPIWLRRWRALLARVVLMVYHFRQAANHLFLLGGLPAVRYRLFAMSPVLLSEIFRIHGCHHKKVTDQATVPMHRCDHVDKDGKSMVARSGNRHGSYAKCTRCGTNWRWNPEARRWEVREGAGGHSAGSSSRSSPPPPTSQDTAPETRTSTRRFVAPHAKQSAPGSTGARRTPASASLSGPTPSAPPQEETGGPPHQFRMDSGEEEILVPTDSDHPIDLDTDESYSFDHVDEEI